MTFQARISILQLAPSPLSMTLRNPAIRPLGSLKTVLRHSRRQQLCRRCYATEVQQHQSSDSEFLPQSIFPRPRTSKTPHQLIHVPVHPNKRIKAPPPPRSTAKAHPFPMKDWESIHLADIDPNGARARLFDPENPDRPSHGDIIHCTFKSGEPFSGICLNVRRRGLDTAVLLRNRVLMTGVEMWVKVFSPNVKSVELVEKATKRPRRAKLYYMRKPKHDRGSVDNVVEQYLKKRRLIRGGALKTETPTDAESEPPAGKK